MKIQHLSNEDLVHFFYKAKDQMDLRKLPTNRKPSGIQEVTKPTEYFDQIMNEDWSYLVSSQMDPKQVYYVYVHIDPRISRYNVPGTKLHGRPFYVGKGIGNRYLSKKRNRTHIKTIDEICNAGFSLSDIAHIYKSDLSEKEAIILESKLINYFGCRSELYKLRRPYINGQKGGTLLNTDFGFRPDWIKDHILSLTAK